MSFMDPLRWQDVQALLDAVLERPHDERVAYVERVADVELREEVLAILAADSAAGSFLEQPMADFAAPLWSGAEKPQDLTGTVVGAFRVLREIGRGGMGAVYLAERADGAFEQRVALKVVLSALARGEVLDRFMQERQILARLEHPGIARLVDGGVTPEGLPFFAMELVEGETITSYCDRLRLDLTERLRLFRRVCEAVHYAHIHLVVHRDLKPSNVLVTAEGQVKLLDFGIAKVLDSEAPGVGLTRTWTRVLTPERASPEQLAGKPVTVASDVYQLGLLLYELLTGRQPFTFEETTPSSIERIVCETDPALASSVAAELPEAAQVRRATPAELARRLRGDLDNIAAKALRKEPERRYAGVSSLLADLDRYDSGLPVSARPDKLTYRVSKFTRRHPFGTAATAALVLLLVAYALTVTLQARRLTAEQERVRIEAQKAERVKDFLAGLFEAADPYGDKGTDITADELVEAGVREVRSGLSEEPAVRAEMLGVLGDVLKEMASYDRASELLKEALEMQREALGSSDHPDLALAIDRYASVLIETEDPETAEKLAREALAMRRRLWGEQHEMVAASLSAVGTSLLFQGRSSDAEGWYRQALAIRRDLPGASDDTELSAVLNNLGVSLEKQGMYVEAANAHRESLEIRRRLFDPDHPAVSESLNSLGVVHQLAGELDMAVPLSREALEIRRRVFGNEHPRVANSLNNLGVLYMKMSRLDEAIDCHREALSIRRAALGAEHGNVGLSLNNLAAVLRDAGRSDEAEQRFREALAIFRKALPPRHPLVSYPAVSLGRLLVSSGRTVEAEALLTEALGIRLEASQESVATAEARLALGLCRDAQGRPEEARDLLSSGLARLLDASEGDRALVSEAEAALKSQS